MKKLTKCQEKIDKKTEIYYYIFNTEEVVKVCYKNYFQFMEQEKKKEKYMLHEESETYTPQEENPISYKHDKTYKDILSDKEEVAYIINQVLDLEEEKGIQPEEIEKYKNSFLTKQFKNKEADIVYKMKEKDIFFLIEHQSKIDYSMPYRLEEYRMEIIRSAIDEKKVKTKNYKMPEVIPIVIYTGEEAWKVRIYLRKLDDELFQNVDLLKYNVIDINQYTQEELLESNHVIDKVFLMEKTKSGEEFAKVLEEIFSKTSKEERQKLCDILKWLLQEKLTDDKVKELIKKAEGEDEDMLAVVEMLRNENRMLREEGRKEGREEICNIIKRLLGGNVTQDKVKELIKKAEGEDEDMLAVVEMLRNENRMLREEGRREGREEICNIIKRLLGGNVTQEKVKELIKKEEGDKEMLAVAEMLRNENRMLREEGRKEGRREGVKEGIRKMVKEMKKKGLEDRLIKEITGLSSEEIRNIN